MFFNYPNILTVRNFLSKTKSYMTELIEKFGRKEMFWKTVTITETTGGQPSKIIEHGDNFLLLEVKN